MSRLVTILMLSLLCLTTGCTYWYQDGKSFNDCKMDLKQCYDDLQKHSCRSEPSCYEVDFMQHSMKEKGYRLVLEYQLPREVKREDPRVDTFWVLAGVSGTIEK